MRRLIVLLTAVIWLLAPVSVSAATYDPFSTACKSGGNSADSQGSVACHQNGQDPLTGPNGIIKKVSLVIATVAGVAAVIIVIISGLRFITANGDAKKAADARSALIGAVVGLVIIAAAEAIVIFVVSNIQ